MITGMGDQARIVFADMRRRIAQQERRMQETLHGAGAAGVVAVDRAASVPASATPGMVFEVVGDGSRFEADASGTPRAVPG